MQQGNWGSCGARNSFRHELLQFEGFSQVSGQIVVTHESNQFINIALQVVLKRSGFV